MTRFWKKRLFWAGGVAVAAAFAVGGGAVGLLVVETGAYNPAATSPHMPITVWGLHTTMIHAVKHRSAGLRPPPITGAQVLAGLRQYDQDCAACHGAPAVDRAPWIKGMNPTPPYLLDAARNWTPSDLYWIIAHGVKMTGMPAWGPSRSPEQIWSLVAFIRAMPDLPPRAYLRLRAVAQPDGTLARADLPASGPAVDIRP
jgi:mono/diheme cytochrome c family protein